MDLGYTPSGPSSFFDADAPFKWRRTRKYAEVAAQTTAPVPAARIRNHQIIRTMP
jgi:hypothetical protein